MGKSKKTKNSDNNIHVGDFSRFRLTGKQATIVGAIITCLILLTIGFILFKDKGTKTNQDEPAVQATCLESLNSINYKEVLSAIGESSAENSQKIIDEIKAVNSHQQDADCLYVLTLFAVRLSRPDTSKTYLGKLNQVLANQQLSNDVLFAGGHSVEVLSKEVEFLQLQKEELQKNVIYGPEIVDEDTEQ